MSEWKEVRLDSLVNRNICYGIVQPGFSPENGIPVIKVNNIVKGLRDISECDKTTEEINNKYKRTILKGGELVISLVGTVGYVDIVPLSFAGANLVRATGMIDIEDELIKYWVLFYIRTKQGQQYIEEHLNTTVQRALNIKDLCKMPIPITQRCYMEKVVSILSSLDSKIENNRKICANLEAQAQALFKHWFIDFAPFKDGKFVESELGMIPEGWRVGKLTEIADYMNGLAMQKFPPLSEEDAIPVLKIKELGQSQIDNNSDKCSKHIKQEYIIKDGDVIFSWSGTLLVDIWCGGICGLNQHLFKVTSKEYPKWFYLLWTKYHLAEFIRIAKDKAVTMGHIKRGDLEKALVAIPDKYTFDKISGINDDILSQIINIRLESSRISSLRDTLLPKLMSGEIKV